MSITEEIMKELARKDIAIQYEPMDKYIELDEKSTEICDKLEKLIADIKAKRILVEDCKLNISTISTTCIKESIKYKGANRRWDKKKTNEREI